MFLDSEQGKDHEKYMDKHGKVYVLTFAFQQFYMAYGFLKFSRLKQVLTDFPSIIGFHNWNMQNPDTTR